MMTSRRARAGNDAKVVSLSCEDAELPKKCVVIRKKKIGENIEKVELRYVAYNRVEKGSKSTTMETINDASSYFKERAANLDYQDVPTSESWAKTVTVQKSEEKGKRKLEQCMPVLASIRQRFAESEKNKTYSIHKRHRSGAMKTLCDEIINEATYVLNSGHPVTSELIQKIANINTLARQVLTNDSKEESLIPDEQELAASKSNPTTKFAK